MFFYNSVIYIWGGFQNNTLQDILISDTFRVLAKSEIKDLKMTLIQEKYLCKLFEIIHSRLITLLVASGSQIICYLKFHGFLRCYCSVMMRWDFILQILEMANKKINILRSVIIDKNPVAQMLTFLGIFFFLIIIFFSTIHMKTYNSFNLEKSVP